MLYQQQRAVLRAALTCLCQVMLRLVCVELCRLLSISPACCTSNQPWSFCEHVVEPVKSLMYHLQYLQLSTCQRATCLYVTTRI
jgi:hypothetical protein